MNHGLTLYLSFPLFRLVSGHLGRWVCSSFLLELFLCSSPVAFWTSTDLRASAFSVLSFCLFMVFTGFSRQECRNGLPFPSPGDHVLSELSTMTGPSWVALHGMAHSFTKLYKAVIYMIIWLVFCDCGFYSVCPLMDEEKRLVQAS